MNQPHGIQDDRLSPGSALPILLLLSAASGGAALIYEIVWFQLLELALGSTAVSLAVVLATFMGGMCLGSLLFPRTVPPGRGFARHPLRVYAAVELGIGACAILVLFLMPWAGSVYTAWSGGGATGFLLRGAVAAVCLLPPTLLMGATLPALARAVRSKSDAVAETGRAVSWLGLLYGANIAGAVFGCALAGFYLLRVYDTAIATWVAVAINATIAATALALAPFAPAEQHPQSAAPIAPGPGQPRAAASRTPAARFRRASLYTAVALSGLCALAAEAIWTRLLGLLFGASVYSLVIILVVFLAGLGIGSGVGSLLCRILARPRLALGGCQLLAAAAIAWSAYNLSASLPYWPIDPSISTSIWFNFALDLDRALWALLPPTLLWGASFPLALAAASADDAASHPNAAMRPADHGRLFASVYAANTLGAIVGALAASLLLVAWVGSQRTEQTLIALSTLAGLLLLLPTGLRRMTAAVPVALLAIAADGLLIGTVPPVAPLLIAHGRYAASWAGQGEVLYSGEGMNSSVAVSRYPGNVLTFHVSGKIQASNVPRDLRLQRMLGHLTTLTAHNPRSVLVIGCGAGVTAGAVSLDPRVERETIVEIEPLVPRAAAAYFGAPNFEVLANPKVELRIDDGRHYLLTTHQRFDGITVDPLDPWVKGAANLYTREFLEAMKQRLNPGGVVTMYIQLFETNREAVRSSVATFFEVFPNGTIWGNTYQGEGHDMVLLARLGGKDPGEPLRIDLDAIQRQVYGPDRGAFARVAQSLAGVDMHSAVDLFATYAGRAAGLDGWLRNAPINRDRNLRMQYLAGFGLNLDDAAEIYRDLLGYRRFPEDLFVSREGRVGELRALLQDGGR